LIDQSELLATIGGLDEAFPVPTGRGDEAVHGGAGIDSWDEKALGHAARDIYIPDLHIDTFTVKPRNFR
jgi:error-prone DNA polymerase